jgi:hypothetical protein
MGTYLEAPALARIDEYEQHVYTTTSAATVTHEERSTLKAHSPVHIRTLVCSNYA